MPGNPRFGLMHVDGKMVPVESEQQAIELICELRDPTGEGANEPPMSYANIAARLNRNGMLMRGKFWNPTTVRDVYLKSKGESDGG